MDASSSRYGYSRGRMNPPTLPSPPSITSSPGLTQSTSNSASNSSSSPPQPETPPRQPKPRYPDLGRVPLHRRGTSQTYENLEDLLREAGYKETRIFTPESDRLESQRYGNDENPDPRFSTRQGVGAAVVGFLTGLVAGAAHRPSSPLRQMENVDDNPDRPPQLCRTQPPLSPLANKQPFRRESSRSAESSEPQTPFMTSSIESLGDPTPRALRPPSRSTTNLQVHHPSQPPQQRVSAAQRHLQKQASKASFHTQHSVDQDPDTHHLPLRAGNFLHHMVSSSSIPPRPSSTPVHPQISYGNGPDSIHNGTEPPLPRKWFDSVAKAVLFGGTGAYAGGPANSQPAVRTLRATRSSLSQTTIVRTSKSSRRPGLSDQTNTTHFLAPPALFTRIERGRASCSESQVIKTRVLCRSAPGSRASSLVRNTDAKDRSRKQRPTPQHGRKGKRKMEEKDYVPSLARTKVEGDGWHGSALPKSRAKSKFYDLGDVVKSAPSSRVFLHGESDGSDDDDNDGSNDDDDDGELDLARMLVPPKRQQSIKSLRKHLVIDASATYATLSKFRASPGSSSSGDKGGRFSSVIHSSNSTRRDDHRQEGDEGEDWDHRWRAGSRGRRTSEEDEEDYENFNRLYHGGGSTRSTIQDRLGLPGLWNTKGAVQS